MNGHRRVAAFVLVGCVAAAVHWSVVVALVEGFAWPPLLANIGGWLVAFGASFGGHALLTFADQRAPAWRAARRFFVVSAAGFVLNQGAYASLLRHGGLSYRVALAAVLLGVAVVTYAASRHWAFLRTPSEPPAPTHPPSTA